MTTMLNDFHACQARRLRKFLAKLDAADLADEPGARRRKRQRAQATRWLAEADRLSRRKPRARSRFIWYRATSAFNIWRRHTPGKLTPAYFAWIHGEAAD